jgi:quinol monooxygenase YgiN
LIDTLDRHRKGDTIMNRRQRPLTILLAMALLHACAQDDSKSSSAPIMQPAGGSSATPGAPVVTEAPGDDAFAGCARGTLEPDMNASPLAGSAVRGGALEPGDYLLSSTYLQLKPEKLDRFQELLAPIETDLGSRDGLVALSLGGSPACGTARTLAVWRDDAAMFAFVAGEAHSAAVRAIGELSRGGSVVTHWTGDQTSATWEVAAGHLAADDGPSY